MTGSRDINAATIAASQADTIHPVLFFKAEFDSGDVLIHTELGNIAFGGDTYIGIGKMGSLTATEEVSDLSNASLSVTLSGIPNDLIAVLLGEQYQGRRATIYLGYLNLTTNVLVDTPVILFRGLMDTSDFHIGKNFSITLSLGSRFAAWDHPKVRRYNNADQQSFYPDDKGLEFVEQAANKTIIWGAEK